MSSNTKLCHTCKHYYKAGEIEMCLFVQKGYTCLAYDKEDEIDRGL